MAVTEKDFTLSWGDITIGAPNTIAVTRPSSQYSFRFRCEFQGVTINLTAPELMIISQDDTRVVFQWTPDESLSLAIPDSVSGTGTLTMTVAYTSRFEQLSNPEFCVKTYDFTAYVPDSMRPSATLTVALVNDNALLEQWGLWVRGMSCLQYAVEASAVGGATLKSCRFTFAGQTVSGFSGVTAPIWQAKASRKVPYVPMTTCSPPKSRTALRMARDVEARLVEGTPPIAKQLKSPCHPRMFIKETTRSSVMFVNRHSKANRSMVVSSVWPDKRSRMSACSEFITVHSNRRICELPHVRRPFRSPFAQWR